MKRPSPKTLAVSLALAALVGCAVTQGPIALVTPRGSDAATPDQAPPERAQVGRKPGLQKTLERTFPGQPPLIPHSIDNIDEVTLAENACLACHDDADSRKANVPQASKSHFVRLAGEPPAFDKSRHACPACHVSQTDAPPLVGTEFRPVRMKAGAN